MCLPRIMAMQNDSRTTSSAMLATMLLGPAVASAWMVNAPVPGRAVGLGAACRSGTGRPRVRCLLLQHRPYPAAAALVRAHEEPEYNHDVQPVPAEVAECICEGERSSSVQRE